jgi:hypothetical protein
MMDPPIAMPPTTASADIGQVLGASSPASRAAFDRAEPVELRAETSARGELIAWASSWRRPASRRSASGRRVASSALERLVDKGLLAREKVSHVRM